MIQILMIADDFTGALDTGVQLASTGAKTRVIASSSADLRESGHGAEVLVVDAETRHLPPERAFEVVAGITRQAIRLGIPHIYKKTDSALRGNIGAELEAMMRASGEEQLPFVPAFPQIGRTTAGGVHYIDGVPVSESVFGRDPFEPVRHSEIRELIACQSRLPVHTAAPGQRPKGDQRGILVYDAQRVEDLEATGRMLAETGKVRILAGCAGFGAILPGLLGIGNGSLVSCPPLSGRLLVVSGSVNPITLAKLDRAEQAGFLRYRLGPEQKLEAGYWGSGRGAADLEELRALLADHPKMIIDANEPPGSGQTSRYARRYQMDLDQVRVGISRAIGSIVSGLFSSPALGTLLVTGGDTLLQCMETMGVREMEPVCELASGVVLSRFSYNGYTRQVISKSGGFGSPALLVELGGIDHKEESR